MYFGGHCEGIRRTRIAWVRGERAVARTKNPTKTAVALLIDWVILAAVSVVSLRLIAGTWTTATELGIPVGAFLAWSGHRRLKGATIGRWIADRKGRDVPRR